MNKMWLLHVLIYVSWRKINETRNKRKNTPKMIKKLMIMIINTKLILKKKHPEKTSSYVKRKD